MNVWQKGGKGQTFILGESRRPPKKRGIIETLATACSVSRRCDDLLSFYLFIVITVTVGNDNITTTVLSIFLHYNCI